MIGWGLRLGCAAGHGFDPGTMDGIFRDPERIASGFQADEFVLVGSGDASCLILPIRESDRVWIIGAGHVGQALAEICRIAGFRRSWSMTGRRLPIGIASRRQMRFG